jgi:hypothetical protein
MKHLVWCEKSSILKHTERDGCTHSAVHIVALSVCFNIHIRKSVLRRMFPVAGCNPVDTLSRVAVKWFDSIILHQITLSSSSG